MALKHYPIPEAIDGENWEVGESNTAPRMSPEHKKMWVPLGDSPHHRAIRAHEQGHVVAGSRIPPPDVNPLIHNAVEDARVNRLVYAKGVNVLYDHGTVPPDVARALGEHVDSFQEAVLKGVCSYYDGAREYFIEAIPDEYKTKRWGNLVRDALDKVCRAKKHEDSVEISRWLMRQLKEEEEREEREREKEQAKKDGDEQKVAQKTAEQDAADAVNRNDSLALSERDLEKMGGGRSGFRETEIFRPPLTEPAIRDVKLRSRTRKRTPTMMGSRIGKAYRMYTDRQCFYRRGKEPGGTVLVDVSGSMGLSAQAVERIVANAPGATVATYCGMGEDKGYIRIVADKKRSAKEYKQPGHNGLNSCDGPALEWLARQPAPRVWVSDGKINGGKGTYLTEDMVEQCRRAIKKGKIMRVDKAYQAVDVMGGHLSD